MTVIDGCVINGNELAGGLEAVVGDALVDAEVVVAVGLAELVLALVKVAVLETVGRTGWFWKYEQADNENRAASTTKASDAPVKRRVAGLGRAVEKRIEPA